jgi:hypothetical protein
MILSTDDNDVEISSCRSGGDKLELKPGLNADRGYIEP